MIRAIFLDLDGTLLDFHQPWQRCLAGFWADHGIVRDEAHHPVLYYDWRVVVRSILHYFPDLGMTRPALEREIQERLIAAVEPDHAVNALVDALTARYRTAILTNGSARLQRGKLTRSGLAGRTGAEFISGALGARKPDRAFFQIALGWAGVEPGEVLMVGNSLLEDIAGGHSAGLQTCAVGARWVIPAPFPQPDHWIDRILDLPGVLG